MYKTPQNTEKDLQHPIPYVSDKDANLLSLDPEAFVQHLNKQNINPATDMEKAQSQAADAEKQKEASASK